MRARKHEVREADLTAGRGERRARLEHIAESRDPEPDLDGPWPAVRIGFTATWTGDVVGYTPAAVCPGCGDQRLRPWEVCVVCHQTRRSPRQWAMMPAGVREKILHPLRPRVAAARTRRERRQRAG